MVRLFVASLLVLGACASDAKSAGRPTGDVIAVDTPTVVFGHLDLSVEEGPVGADDISEINFGSVGTDEGVVLVAVTAEVARTSGLSRNSLVGGGRFEIDLVRPFEPFDPAVPTYLVGALRSAPDG